MLKYSTFASYKGKKVVILEYGDVSCTIKYLGQDQRMLVHTNELTSWPAREGYTYYVTLAGPLLGLALKVIAKSEDHVRLAMNHSKLAGLWCSVYQEPPRYGETVVECSIDKILAGVEFHPYANAVAELEAKP